MLALAYKQLDSMPQFIHHIKVASNVKADKHKRARALYILGQVYEKKKIDSARWAFKSLVDSEKVPQNFKIHANIAYNSLLQSSTNVGLP